MSQFQFMRFAIEFCRSSLRRIGIDVKRVPSPLQITREQQALLHRALLQVRFGEKSARDAGLGSAFLTFAASRLNQSWSQLLQDLFVLFALDTQCKGYFVEFGATDGVSLSNTFMLEDGYGWKGTLAEPARIWRERLVQHRKCFISDKCVWHVSGNSLIFNETPDPSFSTLESYAGGDSHSGARTLGNRYAVSTISLLDLLHQAGAPPVIDYMSVDTEGSEYEILAAFDFTAYRVRVLTVEHNYTANRQRILDLMRSKGFVRVLTNLSQFDDWYVERELAMSLQSKYGFVDE